MNAQVFSDAVPDPADVYVGARIKLRRKYRAMSMTQVATEAGVTWQQLAKYETAQNRVSASKLVAIARALDTPLGYFFEGIETASAKPTDMDKIALAVLLDAEVRDLVAAFINLSPANRKAIKTMVVEMSAPKPTKGD